MPMLHYFYNNGSFQFATLILQKGTLPDTAYTNVDSLRYLSSENDLKAMALLANEYESQENYLLAEKLYFRRLNKSQGIANIKLARQSILKFYQKQQEWSQIDGFLGEQDDKQWHYLSQLHNSKPLTILSSKAFNGDLNRDVLVVGNDFVTRESQLNIKNCKINIVPIASSYIGIAQSIAVISAFNRHNYLSSLPVCFSKPLYIPESQLSCLTQKNKTISCDLTHLAKSKSWPSHIRHLMIMAKNGKANVNQGVMYLAENSSFNVFKHEFMHLFGFEDEYQLSANNQKLRCQILGINSKYSQLTLALNTRKQPLGFEAVPTCNGTGVNAYKPGKKLTLMQYLDKPIPEHYKSKLENNINNGLSDFPVFSMALSTFSQRFYWYQYAAKLGFKGAKLQLALNYESQGNIEQAIKYLQQADDWPLAQSHLARMFYEKSDFKSARAHYLQASNATSDSFAQYFYGKMLLNGIGGQADKSQAIHYFKLSAAQNNPLAVQYLNNKRSL